MTLDLPTLMVGEVSVLLCTALILIACAVARTGRMPLALLGGSHLLTAVGVGALICAALLPGNLVCEFGPLTFALASGLAWAAARRFTGQSAPALLVLAGGLAAIAAAALPYLRDVRGAIDATATLAGGAYLIAAAVEYWSGRGEKLGMRWPMIIVTIVQGVVLAGSAAGFLTGGYAPGLAAPVGTWLGTIHFVSVAYAVGSTVFMLGLVRERKEIAGYRKAALDMLTGLPTRRAFMGKAATYLAEALARDEPLALVVFDLDRFKSINDSFGHACGDEVLRQFGEVMRDLVRSDDFAGRLGGEEFALILPGLSAGSAFVIAERIRSAFAAAAAAVGEHAVGATLSGGVATVKPNSTLESLIRSADDALYKAKAAGRNRIVSAERPHDGEAPAKPVVVKVA
jgi:diguanylate cyclase (GGDEF)-like protein